MKIALACAPVKNQETAFNLRTILDWIARLSGYADLIVFGEAALQGFDCLCWHYETDKHMAVSAEGPALQQICRAAKGNRIAVSLGFIEKAGNSLFSSQIFVGADGCIEHVFRRVSRGWKEYTQTDYHYCEGAHFHKFHYADRSFSIGLCGDLWEDSRPEEMKALNTSIVLWPIWFDYNAAEWNNSIKLEYAAQAALCGSNVLLVNPFCADRAGSEVAAGGAAWFSNGNIVKEIPAGKCGYLVAEV